MSSKLVTPLLAVVAILCAVILVLNVGSRTPTASTSAAAAEKHITLGNKLRQERLYEEALREFEKALDSPAIAESKKSNLAYLMAEVSGEKMGNYERALALLTKAKFYNPSSPQSQEIEQMTVEYLEKLGRSLDAQTKLAAATELDKPEKETAGEETGEVIARIGSREITMDELNEEIQKLPPFAQQRFKSPEGKAQFLQEMVTRELLYNAAKRQGLEKDKEVLSQLDDMRKRIVVSKYYEDEVRGKVTVSDKEVELYYQANPEEFVEPRRVKIAHIQYNEQEEAEQVVQQLKEGKEFSELVETTSVDERTKEKGGELGYVRAGTPIVPGIGRDEELATMLSGLEEGEITEVVEAEGRFHVFKALEVIPERNRELEEVGSVIERQLRSEKEQEIQKELVERLIRVEKVEIFQDAFQVPKSEMPEPQ